MMSNENAEYKGDSLMMNVADEMENVKKLEARNTSEERENIQAKSKRLDEDAMLCNSLWSDRRRLITKTFLAFSCTSKREISLSGEKNFSSATLSAIIYHIRSN